MFYHLFRQAYLIVKRRMETGNTARISKEILPEGITKTTYTYSNDGDELHQFNLYKTADAQLALLAYCINQNSHLQKIFSVVPVDWSVKCMVLNHGVYYLEMAGKLPNNSLLSKLIVIPGLQRMIYGKNFAKDEAYLNSFNPTQYVHKETGTPPILLITSLGDVVCSYQTFKLRDYLVEIEKDCELYVEKSPQAKHVFNIAAPDNPEGKKCNDFILNFCRK